jgi:hypothetical protein
MRKPVWKHAVRDMRSVTETAEALGKLGEAVGHIAEFANERRAVKAGVEAGDVVEMFPTERIDRPSGLVRIIGSYVVQRAYGSEQAAPGVFYDQDADVS